MTTRRMIIGRCFVGQQTRGGYTVTTAVPVIEAARLVTHNEREAQALTRLVLDPSTEIGRKRGRLRKKLRKVGNRLIDNKIIGNFRQLEYAFRTKLARPLAKKIPIAKQMQQLVQGVLIKGTKPLRTGLRKAFHVPDVHQVEYHGKKGNKLLGAINKTSDKAGSVSYSIAQVKTPEEAIRDGATMRDWQEARELAARGAAMVAAVEEGAKLQANPGSKAQMARTLLAYNLAADLGAFPREDVQSTIKNAARVKAELELPKRGTIRVVFDDGEAFVVRESEI